jgi:hypothetical protein
MILVIRVTDGTRDSVGGGVCHGVTFVTNLRRKTVNHTQRIAHVAHQRRSLTKALVREAVERFLEALAEEITSGDG